MAKEMIAMLLAGGQGSRLYALTEKLAKPAVPFGGKYRIIDFPLSNCVNSGIDTVGILTQYQPLVLNEYIGNGQPWDLDRRKSLQPQSRPAQSPVSLPPAGTRSMEHASACFAALWAIRSAALRKEPGCTLCPSRFFPLLFKKAAYVLVL